MNETLSLVTPAFLTVLSFIGILLLASFLRLFNLTKRGLLFWDDGERMCQVLFLDSLIKFAGKYRVSLGKANLNANGQQFSGKPLFDGNPLNIFLYYLTAKIINNIEYSGLVTNFIFGIFGVVGVFFAGAIMFNQEVGLIASLVLSVSGYHLMYSRSVFSEITCGAFYIWATYFYYLSYTTGSFFYLALSGLLIGCAFCSNSRQFYLPAFFVIFEIAAWIVYKPELLFARIIVLGTSMISPLLFIEEIFLVLKSLGYPYYTFFQQLLSLSHKFEPLNFRFPFFKMYLATFYYTEGMPVLCLIIVGIIHLLFNWSFVSVVLLVQFLVPLVFWSVRSDVISSEEYSRPRFISSSLYAMAIIVAVGITSFFGRLPYLILLIVLLSGIYNSWRILKAKSGYKKAISFILSKGDGRHFTFSPAISRFYVGNDKVEFNFLYSNEEKFRELYAKENIRYLLYVKSIHVNTFRCRLGISRILDEILGMLKPVYSIELGMGQFKPFYWDEHNTPDLKFFNSNLIEVFDLSQFFSNR
jgi:hypothetical protein